MKGGIPNSMRIIPVPRPVIERYLNTYHLRAEWVIEEHTPNDFTLVMSSKHKTAWTAVNGFIEGFKAAKNWYETKIIPKRRK